MRNLSEKPYRENSNILYSFTFARKYYRLWDNVQKYYAAGHATDDDIL